MHILVLFCVLIIGIYAESEDLPNIELQTPNQTTFTRLVGTELTNIVVWYTSDPHPNITWFNNQGNLITTNHKYHIVNNDINETMLSVNSLEYKDSGDYRVEIKNERDTKNLIFVLNVARVVNYEPDIEMDIFSHHLVQGENLRLTCLADVYAEFNYTIIWKLPNDYIAEKENRVELEETIQEIGTSGKHVAKVKLTVSNVDTIKDSGYYICEVSDEFHNSNSKTKLITIGDKNDSYIFIQEPTRHYNIVVKLPKKTVRMMVKFRGYPQPQIKWYDNNGQEISNLNGKFEITTETNSSLLKIKDVQIRDSGIYTVKAFNNFQEQDVSFSLLVEDDGTGYIEIYEPIESNNYVTINIRREIVKFVVRYRATPEPTLMWYNNKRHQITQGFRSDKYDLDNGETISSLIIKRPNRQDAGVYTFKAQNQFAEKEVNFTLHVNAPVPYSSRSEVQPLGATIHTQANMERGGLQPINLNCSSVIEAENSTIQQTSHSYRPENYASQNYAVQSLPVIVPIAGSHSHTSSLSPISQVPTRVWSRGDVGVVNSNPHPIQVPREIIELLKLNLELKNYNLKLSALKKELELQLPRSEFTKDLGIN